MAAMGSLSTASVGSASVSGTGSGAAGPPVRVRRVRRAVAANALSRSRRIRTRPRTAVRRAGWSCTCLLRADVRAIDELFLTVDHNLLTRLECAIAQNRARTKAEINVNRDCIGVIGNPALPVGSGAAAASAMTMPSATAAGRTLVGGRSSGIVVRLVLALIRRGRAGVYDKHVVALGSTFNGRSRHHDGIRALAKDQP